MILDAGEDVAEEGSFGNVVEVKNARRKGNPISIAVNYGCFTWDGFGLPKHQAGQVGVDLRNPGSQFVGVAPFSDLVLRQNIHAADVGSDQKRAHRSVDENFYGEVSGLWFSRESAQVQDAESRDAREGDLVKDLIS